MQITEWPRSFLAACREFGWWRIIGLGLLFAIAVMYAWFAFKAHQTDVEVRRIRTIVEGTPGEPGKPGKPGVGIKAVSIRPLPPGEFPHAERRSGGLLLLFLPRPEKGDTGATGARGSRGPRGASGTDGKTIRGPRGFRGRPGASKGLSRGQIIQLVDDRIRIRLLGLKFTCHRIRGNQFTCRLSNVRR